MTGLTRKWQSSYHISTRVQGSQTHAESVFNLGDPHDAEALATFLIRAATYLKNRCKGTISGNVEADQCRTKQYLRQYQDGLRVHSRVLLWRHEFDGHQ